MFIDIWYKIRCPNCKASNWLNNGDISDLTSLDVEGLECWSCKQKRKLDENFNELDDYEEDHWYGDNTNYEKGLQTPK